MFQRSLQGICWFKAMVWVRFTVGSASGIFKESLAWSCHHSYRFEGYWTLRNPFFWLVKCGRSTKIHPNGAERHPLEIRIISRWCPRHLAMMISHNMNSIPIYQYISYIPIMADYQVHIAWFFHEIYEISPYIRSSPQISMGYFPLWFFTQISMGWWCSQALGKPWWSCWRSVVFRLWRWTCEETLRGENPTHPGATGDGPGIAPFSDTGYGMGQKKGFFQKKIGWWILRKSQNRDFPCQVITCNYQKIVDYSIIQPLLICGLPGHGESPLGRPEDFSPEQLAADVRAAVKAISDPIMEVWVWLTLW